MAGTGESAGRAFPMCPVCQWFFWKALFDDVVIAMENASETCTLDRTVPPEVTPVQFGEESPIPGSPEMFYGLHDEHTDLEQATRCAMPGDRIQSQVHTVQRGRGVSRARGRALGIVFSPGSSWTSPGARTPSM